MLPCPPYTITGVSPRRHATQRDLAGALGAAQGCSIPAFTPQLILGGYVSGANVGAAHFFWFQYYNRDHWGQFPSGTPLRRLNNADEGAANQRAMCATGAFVRDPLVPDDSCDEFPLAKTKQSGNLLGIAPQNCSQARFSFTAGQGWTAFAYAGYSSDQRCSLGHVPATWNSSVGGSYSAFIQNQRLLDNDPFWIGFR